MNTNLNWFYEIQQVDFFTLFCISMVVLALGTLILTRWQYRHEIRKEKEYKRMMRDAKRQLREDNRNARLRDKERARRLK